MAPRIAGRLRERMHRGRTLHLEFHNAGRAAAAADVSMAGFNKVHLEALDRLAC